MPFAREASVVGVALALALILLLLPSGLAGWAFLLILLAALGLGGSIYWAQRPPDLSLLARQAGRYLLTRFFNWNDQSQPGRLPAWVVRWRWAWIAAELALVTALSIYAAQDFWKDDPDQTLPGGEVEWQVNTIYAAAQGLHQYGYIPLWNQALEMGHPLLDNPQSVVMNPLSSGPGLLWGGVRGVKVSIALHALVAALGGWYLGYSLRMSPFGRILLAALLLGKGNMTAMLGAGYFQLGTSQAYFGWIIGGTVASLRYRDQRTPPILTAAALTLQFWGGSIWYSLPMGVCMALLTLTHAVYPGRAAPDNSSRIQHLLAMLDWAALRRMAWIGVVAACLSAVTFLPIWLQREYIGDHAPDRQAGQIVDLERAIEQFYNGDLEPYLRNQAIGKLEFYYSFVSPLWLLALAFVILPPLAPWLYSPSAPQLWRVWLVGVVVIPVAVMWGVGGYLWVRWLYEHIPILAQWRFVGRALALASFWIAVLLAMRLDGLAQAGFHWNFLPKPLRYGFQAALLLGLALVIYHGARPVVGTWTQVVGTVNRELWQPDETCIAWLRQQYPQGVLTVYREGYDAVLPYVRHEVRLHEIEADFEPLPLPSTLSDPFVVQRWPAFGIAWIDSTRLYLQDLGYERMTNSPRPVDRNTCLYRYELALPYAYSLPKDQLTAQGYRLLPDQVSALEYHRLPDRIWVQAQSDPQNEQVVTVNELAYPGWRVEVDGRSARLESVGGQLGVVLPPDDDPQQVYFVYRPTLLYLGGIITLMTALGLIGYLLRLDLWYTRFKLRQNPNTH
jgi:hypothetical protein